MKKMMLVVALFSISISAFADTNSAGLAQCISVSANVALSTYAQNHVMYPIPTVLIAKSDRSPSNGIDVKVTVNNAIVYYVIASPIGGGPSLPITGCSGARVMAIAPIGG